MYSTSVWVLFLLINLLPLSDNDIQGVSDNINSMFESALERYVWKKHLCVGIKDFLEITHLSKGNDNNRKNE